MDSVTLIRVVSGILAVVVFFIIDLQKKEEGAKVERRTGAFKKVTKGDFFSFSDDTLLSPGTPQPPANCRFAHNAKGELVSAGIVLCFVLPAGRRRRENPVP